MIRNFLFSLFFFAGIIFISLIFLPAIFLPKKIVLFGGKIMGYWTSLCLQIFLSTKIIIKGRENIPDYPLIIASKHQSAFETFALFYYLPHSVFIHKKQLFLIPIFGQYLKKINMISIDRRGGTKEIRLMLKKAKKKINSGFSIIIFPEGTRKKPGEIADYKTGFIGLYKELNCEILPIAVNSGKY